MSSIDKVYWDACAWLGLINQEKTHHNSLARVYESARRREIEIWTSAFTYAEVYKKRCENGVDGPLDDAGDDLIHDIFSQDFIKRVNVDIIIGTNARKLLRANPTLKKPQDAIHVATALWYNLDILHTFDKCDLLPFDRKLDRRDGKKLIICVPADETAGPLFLEPVKNEENA